MSTPFSFDPARSALLSMDCQTSIVSIYAKDQEPFLARAASSFAPFCTHQKLDSFVFK